MKKISVTICVILVVMLTRPVFAQQNLAPLTIRLDWKPNVQFAGILVAKERGWYVEAGIELTIKSWEKGVSAIDEVLSNRAQISLADSSAIIQSRANGIAIRGIAATFQKSPLCIISKKERGIETLEQLVGKKIGISTPKTEFMLNIMLGNQGLRHEDLTLVSTSGNLNLLLQGDIDALVGFMNNQPLMMKELGHDASFIPAFQHGYDFYSGVYFVSDTMLQDQPEQLQRFLAVTLRGWQEAFNDPAAAAQLVVERYFPNGSISQQTESLKIFQTLANLGEGKKFLGWMEETMWARGVEILNEFAQIEQLVPVEELFTMELLEKIYFGEQK